MKTEIESAVNLCEHLIANLRRIIYLPYFPGSRIHRGQIDIFEERLNDFCQDNPDENFHVLAIIMKDVKVELKSALDLYGATNLLLSNMMHQQRLRDDILRLAEQFAPVKDRKARAIKEKLYEATKILGKITKLENAHGVLLLKTRHYRNSINEAELDKKQRHNFFPSFSIFKSNKALLAQVKPQLKSKSQEIERLYGRLIKFSVSAIIFVQDNPDICDPTKSKTSHALVATQGLRLSF